MVKKLPPGFEVGKKLRKKRLAARSSLGGKANARRVKAEKKAKAKEAKAAPVVTESKKKRHDGSVAGFSRERFESFCRQLLIQSRDSGVVHFEFLGSQKYLLDEIEEGLNRGVTTFVILKNRQAGVSTFFLALDLFEAFEHPGTIGIFATHDEGSRDQFRNQIEVFLTGLPKSHKIDYETNNRLMLVLKNLSMFRYLVAGTRTTTNKLGRSGGCNFAHCTEVAFWGSADDIAAMMQTFSEIYPHRKYFFESTANGFNHYEEMWRIAQDSPAQKAIFIGWWRDERNEFGENHPLYLPYMPEGIKTPLTAHERRKIKEVKDQYGVQITAGQVAWYRFHLETKCSNDQSMMDQEMPWTADDAFIASGGSFFATQTLTDAAKEARQHLCMPFVFKIDNDFLNTQLSKITEPRRAELKIWEMPVSGAKYVIGADPIFGSEAHRDNGVICVGRCYGDCIVQVAEYVSPKISAAQYAWVIAYLSGLYDDVILVLEITGPGAVVFDELKMLKQNLSRITPGMGNGMQNCLRHMKDFLYKRSDSLGGAFLLQWKTSAELRTQLLTKFRDGITEKRLRVRSMHAIEEMRYMTIDEGYIGVPSNKQDDRVFGLALMYWGWDKRVRPRMSRQSGMNIVEASKRDAQGDPAKISEMAQRFLKNANIAIQ